MGARFAKPDLHRFYTYPCDKKTIFDNTPIDMDPITKLLRLQMMKTLDELRKQFLQEEIDNVVYVDIDENNEIQGMDISDLKNDECELNMCLGRKISLIDLTASNWTTMKV
jgi:hypothetical protein